MLTFLPYPLVGVITAVLLLINIIFCASMIVLLGLIKFLIPFRQGRHVIETVQYSFVEFWVTVNNMILRVTSKIEWEIHGEGELNANKWYFIFSNHQTWVDILVLQKIFNRKIPMLKFFLKQELLWSLPVGGLACWMLDFPFMKRYTKAKLKRNPALRNKDIETTKIACGKFKKRPTSVINFLEGTRFTKQKQQERSSPYKNLLRPKAGGLAFVVNELKDYITEVIDVTIIYDISDPSFWNLLCGRIKRIVVFYQVIPLKQEHYGDYYSDTRFRKEFQSWVNDRWHAKDSFLANQEKKKAHENNSENCNA